MDTLYYITQNSVAKFCFQNGNNSKLAAHASCTCFLHSKMYYIHNFQIFNKTATSKHVCKHHVFINLN